MPEEGISGESSVDMTRLSVRVEGEGKGDGRSASRRQAQRYKEEGKMDELYREGQSIPGDGEV